MSTMVAVRRSRSRRPPVADSPLRTFARFVFYLGLGTFIGLGSAWYVLDNGISLDRVVIGQWVLRTDAGQPVADPYTSAYIARSGHIPLRLEGAMYLLATEASDGSPLSGRCTYVVAGPALSGAWWSISLYDPEGSLVANQAERYSFSSTTLHFDDAGGYRITVAPDARAGNWLPSGDGPFVLMLRVHGPDPDYVKAPATVPAPAIETESCR